MQYDKNFIRSLLENNNKIVHCRITSLNMDGIPQDTIQGYTTAGSVNVDGASVVRRTCSLTLFTEQGALQNYYWSLNTRIKLEVGLENHIDTQYLDIIWFNLGHYIITNFNQTLSTNGSTINLSGKDKMCLLNGEVSGALPFEVNFGSYEEIDKNGNRKIIKYPIIDIIRDAIHYYANESFHNIIIKDLEKKGLILQEYRYDRPLYLFRKSEEGENLYFNGSFYDLIVYDLNEEMKQLSELQYDSLNSENWKPGTTFKFNLEDEQTYCVARIDYGETAGYTETDLIYPDELIANAGETITSVLDKIVNMLGDFEYFYDLDGNFIFQRKKTYINNSWTPIVMTDSGSRYIEAGLEKYSYDFTDTSLFTNINITPNINNAKNDYTVWGNHKSITGNDLPIHMRYAIDKKPYQYTTIKVTDEELQAYNAKYDFNLQGQESIQYTDQDYDWRELIYLMALDYRKYNHLSNFEQKISIANPEYLMGKTGYEQYYIDLEGFWRQLYDPNGLAEDGYITDPNDINRYWNKKVIESPNQLSFWFDLLDSFGEINQYSVQNIGRRSIVKQDNAVRTIHNLSTPAIIFTTEIADMSENTGYNKKYFKVDDYNFNQMFKTSTQGKSAKEAIDELIYKHAYCIESLTITAMPIYVLEPNTLITIKDEEHNINGEYIVDKISIPLTYNGTTIINATKAINRIL